MMRLLPLLPRGLKRSLGRMALRGLRRDGLLLPPRQAPQTLPLAGEPSPA
ncbi:hypothetical protein QEG98_21100 [Myxococcus sp. MxC21-1]|nr:hypothetical protein [Myxococcus sp. MxC21-1]WNZ58666.1 hypothetical protein QEG98_21100 [Myxococcus sp. MxC21-1]